MTSLVVDTIFYGASSVDTGSSYEKNARSSILNAISLAGMQGCLAGEKIRQLTWFLTVFHHLNDV